MAPNSVLPPKTYTDKFMHLSLLKEFLFAAPNTQISKLIILLVQLHEAVKSLFSHFQGI